MPTLSETINQVTSGQTRPISEASKFGLEWVYQVNRASNELMEAEELINSAISNIHEGSFDGRDMRDIQSALDDGDAVDLRRALKKRDAAKKSLMNKLKEAARLLK